MTRFLCCTLLLLIALPLHAQVDPPPVLGQTLPRDPALLMRMRDQLTFELRETQRALGFINPNDTQLVETLRTRQTELARQMSEITNQIQTLSITGSLGELGSDAQIGFPPEMPPVQPLPTLLQGLLPGTQAITPLAKQESEWQPQAPMPAVPLPGTMPSGVMGGMPPANYPAADMSNASQWGVPAQAWEAAHWGPRLPRELTEVRQSVESLQSEIAELKETIKRLETQIQLLNHTVLLSSERTNARSNDRVRESEE